MKKLLGIFAIFFIAVDVIVFCFMVISVKAGLIAFGIAAVLLALIAYITWQISQISKAEHQEARDWVNTTLRELQEWHKTFS